MIKIKKESLFKRDFKKFYGESEYKGLTLIGKVFILPFKAVTDSYKEAYTTKREWRVRDILLDAMDLIWYIFVGSAVLVLLNLKGVFLDIFIGIIALYLVDVFWTCFFWVADIFRNRILGLYQGFKKQKKDEA